MSHTTVSTHSPLDRLLCRLAASLGERLRTDDEALDKAANDESGMPGCRPGAVAFVQTAAEVSEVAREAASLGVGLVPRGGGTGKAGGCIPRPDQLVVDLSRMNRVQELNARDGYVVVEPGIITGELDLRMAEHGLLYPPAPGSADSCTVGGNIATNAGGARAFKYGVTRAYVWRLDVVLPGGTLLRTGRITTKSVAGYDLAQLLVGSEGTLGFIVQAVMHVIPRPADVQTAWLTFADVDAALSAGAAILQAGVVPRILEVMDGEALRLVQNATRFAVPQGGAALLLETDGEAEAAMAELTRGCEVADQQGATDSAVAMAERDREAMRRARKLVSSRMKEDYPKKISDDLAVPPSRLSELLHRARDLADAAGLATAAYGHLADGNVHINLLCKDDAELERGERVRPDILAAAVACGGTISGEHGIGLLKRAHLPLQQTPELLALQRQIKAVFDPHGLMNPGKVFG